MKLTKLTIAVLSAAAIFTSCNDDDDISEGRFDRAELYVTSNTNGAINVYDFSDNDGEVTQTTLTTTGSTDNEGIIYDPNNDQLLFSSRTNGTLAIADDIENLIDGTSSTLAFNQSSSDLTSPRSVAVSGNFIVVADNDGDGVGLDGNELFVYQRSGSTLTLRNTVVADFPLWQIQFVGDDLFAVVDQSSDLAVFNNFLNNNTDATVAADKTVTFEGINRTHGFVINQADDIAILTDIGDAGVDNDGAFHVITGFTTKFGGVADGGTLVVQGNQVRVAGAATNLGNPVAASYDAETNTIFIAERANAGGRVLGFDAGASMNEAPIINNLLPGASTVFFYGED